MSSPNIKASMLKGSDEKNSTFIPKEQISLSYGKSTVYVYPPIVEGMSNAEKSYAYMMNKAAIATADITPKTKLQAFGHSMGCTALVNVMQASFIDHANEWIFSAARFNVDSYHSRNGLIIADATEANGDLKSTDGVSNADRRPANIQFARLSTDIRFTAIDPSNTQPYPYSYYVRLPMELENVTDDAGNGLNLYTFQGENDWADDTDQENLDLILQSDVSIGKPFLLAPPSIKDPNADASIDVNTAVTALEKIALEASWEYITKAVFDKICPNFVEDPSAVITGITQEQFDPKTNETITLSVSEYYNAILNCANFFPQKGVWEVDVVQHFQAHLLPSIKLQMKTIPYNYISTPDKKTPFQQMIHLQKAFSAASTAESSLDAVRTIAKQEFATNHALYGNVTNHSTAENTISKYTKSKCWGCGDENHAYKEGEVIICPHKDKPGVAEKAEKGRQLYNTYMRKKRGKNNGGGKRKAATAQSNNALFANATKGMNQDQVEAFLASATSPAKAAKTNDSDKEAQCFPAFVDCFTSTNTDKPLLPINIDPQLPHIKIGVGSLSDTVSLALSVVYDTAAVVNVGNSDFHLAFAKQFPHTVKSLTWAEDKFTKLTLSGVVSDDGNSSKQVSLSTDLPVVIEYHMPYKSKAGSAETSIKFALGKQVGVNSILSNSTIRAAKMSMDVVDEVVDSGVLDTVPFPIFYRRTMKGLPNFSNMDKNGINTFFSREDTAIIANIEICESFLTQQAAKQADSIEGNKSAEVVSSAIVPYHSDKSVAAAQAKAVSFNNSTALTDTPVTPSIQPIIVPKPKWRAKTQNLWKENLKDDEATFEYLLQNRLSHTLRRKAASDFPPPNPKFAYTYDDTIDRAELERNIIFDDHISPALRHRTIEFVKEFWDVFREGGVSIPVQGYEMVIDTGDAKPIAVRQPHYGLHETPIMQKTIDNLLKLNHITKDTLSPWAFGITLAPKPHQEHVTDIDNYIWRFCVNYIRLNMITRPAEYPIPRCDDAVMYGFGAASYFILLDAFSGYHQVRLSPASSIKTAFHAPHGRKYRWLVMPFGLRNCPIVFISMMHDFKEKWEEYCSKHGIDPSIDEGSLIIMDDILLHTLTEDNAFITLRGVCLVARKYHLTLKLKKCRWFPQKLEYVGVDLSLQGNQPASSKFGLLKAWKTPATPRAIMSFIGFAIFYVKWIPYFELKVKPLRELISQHPLDYTFSNEFTEQCNTAYENIKSHLLSAPILQRANIRKRFYLKTDFSAVGLGFALCQPDDSQQALAAMQREDEGGDCEFDLTLSNPLRLLPVALGSRKTIGNEKHLHGHPGESLAASWGVTSNRHFLWGRPFTLITDCRALLWLMNYTGHNHAVKRLQMELYGYWWTMANRPGRMLADGDFMSRVGEDLRIDPLLKDYLSIARQSYVDHPPAAGDMSDQNMPGRRNKRPKPEPTEEIADVHLSSVINEFQPIEIPNDFLHSMGKYQNVPVVFTTNVLIQPRTNRNFSYIGETATSLKSSAWCLFQPKYGHFLQSSRQQATQIEAIMAIESTISGRNALQEYWEVPIIKDSLLSAIQYFTTKVHTPKIQAYYAAIKFEEDDSKYQVHLQNQIVFTNLLKTMANLKLFIFEIRTGIPPSILKSFINKLRKDQWRTSVQDIQFSHHSDKISGQVQLLFGTHKDNDRSLNHPSFFVPSSPQKPNGFGTILFEQFNTPEHSVPYIGDIFKIVHKDERHHRQPTVEIVLSSQDQPAQEVGYQVYHKDYPAPLPTNNQTGLFGQLFGVTYLNPTPSDDPSIPTHLIRAISTSEYISAFGYDANFNYLVAADSDCLDYLEAMIPVRTMQAIQKTAMDYINQELHILTSLHEDRFDIDMSPSAFLNGIINDELPSDKAWEHAYRRDPSTQAIIKLLEKPFLITTDALTKVHSAFRNPIRESHIKMVDKRLCYFEPVANSTKAIKLIIVPKDLHHHIFACFHSNPLGGHYSLYYTLHRIRLRYTWPGMYSWLKKQISSCAACMLRDGVARPSSELLYSFPIDAPMFTVHADLWQPGDIEGFDGNTALMVILCHMTGFAAIEPIAKKDSQTFAQAVYKIFLRYGMPHLIITDADSKFKGEFKDMAELLKLKHHTVAKGNHNAIFVERFNRFLNSGLRVFNNDRGTNRVFVEGALTLCYAWNSCPVTATDLSRSLLAVGREFQFPIDFTSRYHITYDTDESQVRKYADELCDLLTKSREIYEILISEHRAMHREYRNAQLNHVRKFKLGDIVFTNVQVQSRKSSGTVAKLAYIRRGPYKIIKSFNSGTYQLQLINGKSKAIIKKHGSDLFLSPKSLVPHQPIHSSDHAFSEFNKGVITDPYELAGLDRFVPSQPWATPIAFANIKELDKTVISFPTVDEMDADYDSWPESGNPFTNDASQLRSSDKFKEATGYEPSINIDSPDHAIILQSNANTKPATSPSLSQLIASIIKSDDKLFFIAYSKPNEQRKEWKLVQLDFERSMHLHPPCLQDGKFIFNFYIQHHNDNNVHITDRRFWLEYHQSNSLKSLSSNYNIIQPSDVSHQVAKSRNLIPYREWIYIHHSESILHGPFNFAIKNKRKTRDRIAQVDWDLLLSMQPFYNNDPPTITNHIVDINMHETSCTQISDDAVSSRVNALLFQMHFDDTDLSQFNIE